MDWAQAKAVIGRGFGVASGTGSDTRFPLGTIRPQLRFLEAGILGLAEWLGGPIHPGTINLVMGGSVEILAPEIVLRDVAWTDLFPPENFFLSRCLLEAAGVRHPAYLYIPDPATKPDHIQHANIVELLAAFIPGLAYDDPVTLHYSPAAIAIRAG